MTYTKQLFFYVLSLVFSQALLAQKGTVKGQVIDGETGEPLFSANAIINGTGFGATTDFDGNFSFQADPGTYDLQISFIGMQSTTIPGVEVKAGEVTTIDNVKLDPASSELEAVTITAAVVRNTEAAMITAKRKSANVMDGISAGKLKQTGDSDAGDAAKRVTGVSVEGGKYVFVRGLGDRYTKTMLNGVDIPGLDPDRNAIQIDIFPTNLIDNMSVVKSGSAEYPADFSGGLVNIETKAFPTKPHFNVSGGLGYNPSMHFNSDYLTYEGSNTDFLGFDGGERSLPDEAATEPIPSPAYGHNPDEVNNFLNDLSPTLGASRSTSFMDYSLGVSLGDEQALESGNKLGYTFAVTYKNSTNFYDDVSFGEYQRPAASDEYELEYATVQNGQLGESNVLVGALGGMAYKTNTSQYKLTLMHLQNGESRASQFNILNSESATGQSGYRAFANTLEYSQRGFTNLLLDGKHSTVDDSWVLEWKVSPTLSNIEEPDLRRTAFTIRTDSTFVSGAGGNPYRIWRNLDEINTVGKADVTRNLEWFDRDARIKFGISHVFKERDYNILSYDLQAFGSHPDYSGDPNEVLSDENLYPNGNLYYQSLNGNPNPNEYNSVANNSAAYASTEFAPLLNFKAILGLRAEYFVQRHTGRDMEGSEAIRNNTKGGNVLDNEKVLESLDLFPSANLIYAVDENTNLRVSYFKSIARPSFKELSFAQIIDPISNRIFNGGLHQYGDWDGNLTSTRIHNLDLRWEWFINRGGLISVSTFYKQFSDPIELVRIPEAQTTNEFQVRNVGDGSLYGAEFELRHSLEFINPILSKFSFSGNFTYAISKIEMTDLEYEARKRYEKDGQTINRTRDMAGQAPFIINAGLVYNDVKTNFNTGIYYNMKGRTLEIVGGGLFPDVYSEPFHSLNFTLSKSFGQENRSSLSLKVSNILNDARESFYAGYKASDRIFSRFNPGLEISVGNSYDIW